MEPKVILKNVSKDFVQKGTQKENISGLIFKKKRKEFHAVKDVSFSIMPGETVGLIGINGSGKSTLSNMIAKIFPPTSGELIVHGQPTLIAIGAGLSDKLTGKENVYLKCLMMGLSNQEVDAIYQEIVEFSEIGDFINQPLKSYSSGMRSRLGFAIAIHIEPDIMVIDEALAVGDQTFSQKCHEKIDEFKQNGKTIVYVSHSSAEMRRICDRVAWIHQGNLVMYGPANEVLDEYNNFVDEYRNIPVPDRPAYTEQLLERMRIKRGEFPTSKPKLRFRRKVKADKKKISLSSVLNVIVLLSLAIVIFLGMLLMFTSDQTTSSSIDSESDSSVDSQEASDPSSSQSSDLGETDENVASDSEIDEASSEEITEGLSITFESDYVTVEQGGSYDLTEGMTIQDDTDTEEELLENLSIYAEPTVFDINVPGVYELTYVVTNSQDEEATATRTFEVVPVE